MRKHRCQSQLSYFAIDNAILLSSFPSRQDGRTLTRDNIEALVAYDMMDAAAELPSLDGLRRLRDAVRKRHAGVLANGRTGQDTMEARNHPRWAELVVGKQHDVDTKEAEQEGKAIPYEATGNLLGPAYIPSESTVRNDYSQHFVDTGAGELPSNAVRNPEKATRFAEYPKLRRLVDAKADLLNDISIPPTYLQADLLSSITGPSGTAKDDSDTGTFHLASLLPIKYDVVIVDPPLEAYEWESVPSGGKTARQAWSWDQVAALPIPQIVAKESFIFLWVGSGASDGLERGREVLARWGYRRCEDIVWIRTTPEQGDSAQDKMQAPSSSTFVRTVEHCLMGIRGTVRRTSDTRFVHCNIDTDVILWPGEPIKHSAGSASEQSGRRQRAAFDARSKPPEMMDLIENFCLGTRRLELFGRNRNLRRGWLTIGIDVGPGHPGWQEASRGVNACAAAGTTASAQPMAYEKPVYNAAFGVDKAGCTLAERSNLVLFNEEIESLRPKSPQSAAERAVGTGGEPRHRGAAVTASTGYDPTLRGMHSVQHTAMPHANSPLVHPGSYGATAGSSGAGLSGLGAGGRAVVSVPSGSELLSGAQASVLLGQGHGQRGAGGPTGLSRRGRRF